jgi:hypothetical protein
VPRYFAPISPAAQTRTLTGGLMDQLSKGPAHQPRQVQQLEDGIRRQLGLAGPPQQPPAYGSHRAAAAPRQRPQEARHGEQGGEQDGMSAFKKLVSGAVSCPSLHAVSSLECSL